MFVNVRFVPHASETHGHVSVQHWKTREGLGTRQWSSHEMSAFGDLPLVQTDGQVDKCTISIVMSIESSTWLTLKHVVLNTIIFPHLPWALRHLPFPTWIIEVRADLPQENLHSGSLHGEGQSYVSKGGIPCTMLYRGHKTHWCFTKVMPWRFLHE